ncbi:hypothetical protein AB0L25_12090, partial [Spirillospora sp. NPDC052242]
MIVPVGSGRARDERRDEHDAHQAHQDHVGGGGFYMIGVAGGLQATVLQFGGALGTSVLVSLIG